MKTLSFTVIGIPKGQPRVKARARGRFAQVYDPGTADEWKLLIRDSASKEWDKVQFQGPLSLRIVFYMPRPKAHYRSNGEVKAIAPNYHTSKPDADNCAKAAMDALTNLGIWRDDSQVSSLSVRKLYRSVAGCDMTIAEEVL